MKTQQETAFKEKNSSGFFNSTSTLSNQFVNDFQLQASINNFKKGLELIIKNDLKINERSLEFYEELAKGRQTLDILPLKLKNYFVNQQKKLDVIIETNPDKLIKDFNTILFNVITDIKNQQFELTQRSLILK